MDLPTGSDGTYELTCSACARVRACEAQGRSDDGIARGRPYVVLVMTGDRADSNADSLDAMTEARKFRATAAQDSNTSAQAR